MGAKVIRDWTRYGLAALTQTVKPRVAAAAIRETKRAKTAGLRA
jgi:hypothetical protein